jgi:hypothetical protein
MVLVGKLINTNSRSAHFETRNKRILKRYTASPVNEASKLEKFENRPEWGAFAFWGLYQELRRR